MLDFYVLENACELKLWCTFAKFCSLSSLFSEDKWVNWVDLLSEKNYVVIDNVLPEVQLNSIVESMNEHLAEEAFKKAAIGTSNQKHIDRSIRGDEILWLNKDTDPNRLSSFFTLAEETKDMLNRLCYLSLSGYEFHFAHYPKGTFYKRHLDQFQGRNNRMISVILYLNKNWQPEHGGGLKLFFDNTEEIVEPIFGRLVMFRSDVLEHEVLITNQDRYSITGWMLYNPVGLGFL